MRDPRAHSQYRSNKRSGEGMEQGVDDEMRRFAEANGYTIKSYNEVIEYLNGEVREKHLDENDLQD